MICTGYNPTRRCASDPILYATSAVPPSVSKTDLSMIPVLMQAELAFCVEHAITTYVMWLYYKQTGKVILLSPRSLVINVIRMMGSSYTPGGGTNIRIALEAAQKYGIAEEALLPNTTTLSEADYNNPALLTDEVNQNALKYRIGNFYFLSDLSEGGLKQALSQYDLALYGIDISDSWWKALNGVTSWSPSDILPIRPPKGYGDPSLSKHLVCGSGYDTTPYDYFRNSFGATWGEKGDGWYGTNDLPFLYEAAVIEGLLEKPVIQQAQQIVSTIDELQSVKNPTNSTVISQLITQLWAKFLSLFTNNS